MLRTQCSSKWNCISDILDITLPFLIAGDVPQACAAGTPPHLILAQQEPDEIKQRRTMEMPDVGPLNPTRLIATPYPDVPSDIGNRLDELIRTHEHMVRALRESAELLESIQRQTTGAVQQVLATSQGQATQALADTWHPAQSDFRQAHQGMRDAASHLDTATELLLQQVPTIQAAMRTVEMLRGTGGYVSAMKADGVQAQIDKLNNALASISIALDAAAMMLNQLNGGWPLACATGFDPKGSFVPTFAPNSFQSPVQGGTFSVKRENAGRDAEDSGEQDIKDEHTTTGISEKMVEAAKDHLKDRSIFIIGAMGVGKSSLSKLLAHVLGARVVSLDTSSEYAQIMEKYGFTAEKDQLTRSKGFDVHREWIEPIFVESITDILTKYPKGIIIDTGGSHPITQKFESFTRFQESLNPFTVIHLTITEDQSIDSRIFHEIAFKRHGLREGVEFSYNRELNEYIVQFSGFEKLANATVETGNKTLNEIQIEVLKFLAEKHYR